MFKNLNAGALGIRDRSLPEIIELARKGGFGGVDFDIRAAAALAEERGVDGVRGLFEVNDILPGSWGLPVAWRDDEQWMGDLNDLPELAALGRQLGCPRTATYIRSGSNERPYKENFAWHVSRFRPIAEVLNEEGCRLGLEFLGPKTMRENKEYEFIHTLDQLMELAEAIGTGNVGVLLDAWHLYTSGGTAQDAEGLTAEEIVIVHVNDAPAGVDREAQIDSVRKLPMTTGVIDLESFMHVLIEVGYDGPVTPEPFSVRVKAIAQRDPLEAVKMAAETMDRLWQTMRE